MSFGGAVASMITSLKNNARDRKTLYDNKDLFYKKVRRKTFIKTKNATPEQLEVIKNRLIKEHKQQTIRLLILLLITFTILASAFIYFWL
ncbi:hypothetical protein [Robertkochia solimangrovi]|uniref:hypothetical protein n=1 Tax=Robertkochia solimangrovi TaxID=2213046 RepID=UPI0011813FE0|nr:hypothetical protein [Robertkochia solimangrovi]TRZ41883.1 hypothetical protein DMZ48_16190 [Robertkochia solimangrovi]